MFIVSYDKDGIPRRLARLVGVEGKILRFSSMRNYFTQMIAELPYGSYEFVLNPVPARPRRDVNAEMNGLGSNTPQSAIDNWGRGSTRMPTEEHIAKAKRLVFEYVKARLEKTDTHVEFSPHGVYIVKFSFVLGNWKALVSTILSDGMYYEVTYDVNKGESYIDAYKKWDNVCVPDRVESEQMKG